MYLGPGPGFKVGLEYHSTPVSVVLVPVGQVVHGGKNLTVCL